MKPVIPRKARVKELVDEILRNSEEGDTFTSYSMLNKIAEIRPSYSRTIDVKYLVAYMRGHPMLKRGDWKENKVRVYILKGEDEIVRRKNEPTTLQAERAKEATN